MEDVPMSLAERDGGQGRHVGKSTILIPTEVSAQTPKVSVGLVFYAESGTRALDRTKTDMPKQQCCSLSLHA